MFRFHRSALFFCCLLVVATTGLAVPSPALGYEILIDVAPNVINIQSEGEVVTVHTDIAYSAVVGATVFINGVAISHWKSDARGYFVAKFISEQIKDLDLGIGEYNTLTLTGYDTEGGAFIGEQDILVINNIPRSGVVHPVGDTLP